MRKRIVLFNFIIVTLSLLGLFLFGISVNKDAHYKEAEERIIEITEVYTANYNENIAKTAPRGVRVTVISAGGEVISDSAGNADKLENHAEREEVIAAYQNSPKITVRYSSTLGKDMVYYAKKAITNAETGDFVIVRTAIAVESVNEYVLKTAATSFYILLAALFLSLLASFFAADGLIKPLKEVSKNLKAVNDGTYKSVTLVKGDEEVNAVLAEINELSEKLLTSINVAKENESRLDYVINNVLDGIIVLNESGNIEIANKNAAQIFNVDTPQGKNYEVLTENALFNKKIGEYLGGGEKPAPFELESDGEKVFYTSINRLENGFTIIVLSDITAVKNAEKSRGEFFANAGHELKTPLTAIKGFNDMIGLSADGEIKVLSQKIDKEVTRIIGLINDMLSLSRLDDEKPDKTEETDLALISRSVKESLAPLCEKKQVNIEINGNATAKIEKEHAIELIKNLVENGVRYNDDGGYVKVNIEKQKGGVSLVVSDNGIGIEPEHVGRVFERFYRVNKSRSRETGGTGLGLAIVKHICALYGAEIKLESKLGVGTKVSVFIPD